MGPKLDPFMLSVLSNLYFTFLSLCLSGMHPGAYFSESLFSWNMESIFRVVLRRCSLWSLCWVDCAACCLSWLSLRACGFSVFCAFTWWAVCFLWSFICGNLFEACDDGVTPVRACVYFCHLPWHSANPGLNFKLNSVLEICVWVYVCVDLSHN